MPREITCDWRQKVAYERFSYIVVLRATLSISDAEEDVFWHGELTAERYGSPSQTIAPHAQGVPAQIQVTLPYDLIVFGELTLRKSGTQWVLWTDGLVYGCPGEKSQKIHGWILSFESTSGWIPSGPVPPGGPPKAPPPPPARASTPPLAARPKPPEGTLFQYQLMQVGRKPDPSAISRYPPRKTADLPDTFVQCLTQLRASGAPDARLQMEKATVAYIEGNSFNDSDFTSAPFLSDIKGLPVPFSVYPQARAMVAASTRKEPPEAIIAALQGLVGTPGLNDAAYLTTLTCAWQSLFALIIELGKAEPLRRALMDIVVVDHLLVWLASARQERVTSADLEALSSATVILPGKVFPLPS